MRLSLIKYPVGGGGGGGTVTSVGLTMPSAFTVTGSPITTAGTFTVTGSGTTAQYIRGDGSLATFPVTGAVNGLSLIGTNVVLGQNVGQIGNPAILLSNREVPMGGFTFQFTGSSGNFVVDSTGLLYILGPSKLYVGGGNIVFSYNLPSLGTFTGGGNVAIGLNGVFSTLTSGFQNIAIGDYSSTLITTGNRNLSIGAGSLQNLVSGSRNIGIGYQALQYVITSSFNIGIGNTTGNMNCGDGNTIIGNVSIPGSIVNTYGNTNIIIGFYAQFGHDTIDNNIVIGNNSYTTSTSNTTIIGNSINTALSNVVAIGKSTQNVIIGLDVPNTDNGNRLQVNGSLWTSGINTFTNLVGTGTRMVVTSATGILSAQNLPVISNSFSQSASGTTVFTVPIGSSQPTNTYKVNVTATNLLSAAFFYVTNKTLTTFDVVYLAGLTGTVTFDWALFN